MIECDLTLMTGSLTKGALLMCNELDEACEMQAASADRGQKKEISAVMEYLGRFGQNHGFSFFVIPPAPRSLERRER